MARPVGDSVGEILILSMTRCSLPTAKASAAWPPARCCLPAAARGLSGFCPVCAYSLLFVAAEHTNDTDDTPPSPQKCASTVSPAASPLVESTAVAPAITTSPAVKSEKGGHNVR
jgi:hypothetical protein